MTRGCFGTLRLAAARPNFKELTNRSHPMVCPLDAVCDSLFIFHRSVLICLIHPERSRPLPGPKGMRLPQCIVAPWKEGKRERESVCVCAC